MSRYSISREQIIKEWNKCSISPAYFVQEYCKIYDATEGTWIPFEMWPLQLEALELLHSNKLLVVLKARQLGLTWLGLCYATWIMLFQPIATVLIFSRRDDDATYLLGDERLRGIYLHLPEWLQAEREVVNSSHQWRLSNGSNARAFPTTGGDSYTATYVMVDEADLIPDLNRLLRSTKPTIDAGGKMVLVSRSDKTNPGSEFKAIYESARKNENGWAHIFLPWYTRPSRTKEWYEQQRRDILSRTGSLDDLYEQYPETPEEALAPRSLDRRLASQWLLSCYEEHYTVDKVGPAIPQLKVYIPVGGPGRFVIGADPAEGNPNSDDSALTVIDQVSGEEVASLAGKFEPSVFADILDRVSNYFNLAPILVERNNHGHAVILWLEQNSKARVLMTEDNKMGWFNNSKGKAMLYDYLADGLRDGLAAIHNLETFKQLSWIEGSTLRAPEGKPDDLAVSYALAWQAIKLANYWPIMRQAEVKW